jgi:mono/diheme cytochrome c family protein
MTSIKSRGSIACALATFVMAGALRLAAESAPARSQTDQPSAPTRAQVEFFEAKIRPVLFDTCGECHLDDEEGGLRVDSRERLLAGGESGPALVPGDPDKSLLLQAMRRDPGAPRMPKGDPKLSDEIIAAFTEWIKQGAPWPASGKAAALRHHHEL